MIYNSISLVRYLLRGRRATTCRIERIVPVWEWKETSALLKYNRVCMLTLILLHCDCYSYQKKHYWNCQRWLKFFLIEFEIVSINPFASYTSSVVNNGYYWSWMVDISCFNLSNKTYIPREPVSHIMGWRKVSYSRNLMITAHNM